MWKALIGVLSFYWLCIKEAAHGTVERANAWFWLVGLPIVAFCGWYWELGDVHIPDTLLGFMTFMVMTIAATWIVFFLFRLLGAPARLHAEAQARIATLEKKPSATQTQLQQFYVQLGNLWSSRLPKDISEGDFQTYKEGAEAVVNAMATWIRDNMGQAALARFTDRSDMLDTYNSAAVNETHNRMMMNQAQFRKNLLAMIESGAWSRARRNLRSTSQSTTMKSPQSKSPL